MAYGVINDHDILLRARTKDPDFPELVVCKGRPGHLDVNENPYVVWPVAPGGSTGNGSYFPTYHEAAAELARRVKDPI